MSVQQLTGMLGTLGSHARRMTAADWNDFLPRLGHPPAALGVNIGARWAALNENFSKAEIEQMSSSPRLQADVMSQLLHANRKTLLDLDKGNLSQWNTWLADQKISLPDGARPDIAWQRIRATLTEDETLALVNESSGLKFWDGFRAQSIHCGQAQSPRPSVAPRQPLSGDKEQVRAELVRRGMTEEIRSDFQKTLRQTRSLTGSSAELTGLVARYPHIFQEAEILDGATLARIARATQH